VEIAFALVALAVVVLFFTGVSERLGFPAPLALTVVGIVGAYLPGVPEIHLGHDVVLFGLLPPLLYAAAMQTSLVDFRANVRPILLLSVGLVIATTLGVAVVVHALLPGLGWPAAFAIGAVVAPPDAVAATAIGRRIGLPRQLVSILEGESLFNDATALVALRTAIAATAGVTALHVGEEPEQTSTGCPPPWSWSRGWWACWSESLLSPPSGCAATTPSRATSRPYARCATARASATSSPACSRSRASPQEQTVFLGAAGCALIAGVLALIVFRHADTKGVSTSQVLRAGG
jgi:hypothetical protein